MFSLFKCLIDKPNTIVLQICLFIYYLLKCFVKVYTAENVKKVLHFMDNFFNLTILQKKVQRYANLFYFDIGVIVNPLSTMTL